MKGRCCKSVPEPAPVADGKVVPDLLIRHLLDHRDRRADARRRRRRHGRDDVNAVEAASSPDGDNDDDDDVTMRLIELIRQRDAFGRAKYGQPLMTRDGRDGQEDALQELGDLVQYVYKMYLVGQDLTHIQRMTRAACDFFESLPRDNTDGDE